MKRNISENQFKKKSGGGFYYFFEKQSINIGEIFFFNGNNKSEGKESLRDSWIIFHFGFHCEFKELFDTYHIYCI